MALYCGIDLHSSNCQVVVLDQSLATVAERRHRNDLGEIVTFLEPHREELVGIAVESTRNWYWLVDGLMDAGHQLDLANTSAIQQYERLKYTDDRHDARWLARLRALGILPEGYIYPRQERSWRDLLRRRAFLVRSRTSQLLAIQALFEQYTGRTASGNEIKQWTVAAIREQLADPQVVLAVTAIRRVVDVLSTQIRLLEKEVIGHAELRQEFALLRFCCYVNTNLSKEAGRLHRWRGPLLQRRYQAIAVSNEEEAQIGRLRYLLAHGCKEGLVARLRDWPGPHCADALASGETCAGIWFDRHQEWLARVRGEERPPDKFCTRHELSLAPLPCWRHLPPLEAQRRIANLVAEIESEAAARHHDEGRKPLGRAGILRQDPHDHPASSSRSPAPLVHAASKRVRREMRVVYYQFVAAFRAAAKRLGRGCKDVVFPDGCFPPPLPFCRSG